MVSLDYQLNRILSQLKDTSLGRSVRELLKKDELKKEDLPQSGQYPQEDGPDIKRCEGKALWVTCLPDFWSVCVCVCFLCVSVYDSV